MTGNGSAKTFAFESNLESDRPPHNHNAPSVHEDRRIKRSFLFPVESSRGKETTVYGEDTNTQ